jgi:hypothetical protein
MNRLSTIDEELYHEGAEKKMANATAIGRNGDGSGEILPYKMHVSGQHFLLSKQRMGVKAWESNGKTGDTEGRTGVDGFKVPQSKLLISATPIATERRPV